MDNYIVEAASPEEAKDLARQKFNGGEPADICGNEWEILDYVSVPEPIDSTQ